MTYEQLVDFLISKMKMSHIYQPLLVRSLVDVGGSATLRQLATFFLSKTKKLVPHCYTSHVHRLNVHFGELTGSRAPGLVNNKLAYRR
jgi:hypothetical protein